MNIKVTTEVYQCEEGHNFILLDENFENIVNVDIDELCCPKCGESVATSMTRVIQIDKVS